jgi:hypothetical protein
LATEQDKHKLTGNHNGYHNEREKKVLDLCNQGRNTRDIAKELRMYLRDLSIILRNNQVSHGIVTTKDNGNGNIIPTKPTIPNLPMKKPPKLIGYYLKVKSHLK